MDKTQRIDYIVPAATHDELGDLNYDRQRVTNENGRTTRIPRIARPKLLQWLPTIR